MEKQGNTGFIFSPSPRLLPPASSKDSLSSPTPIGEVKLVTSCHLTKA